jgi:hypothetical protein
MSTIRLDSSMLEANLSRQPATLLTLTKSLIGGVVTITAVTLSLGAISLIMPTSAVADNMVFCNGKVKKGAINGKHTCTFPSGNQFEGEFKLDQRQGKGSFSYADGTKCEGTFVNDRLNGFGKCTYAGGNRYEGEWRDNRRQGAGTFTYADGTKCEGTWRDDGLNGFGKCQYRSGNRYEGMFANNARQGRGAYIYSNGIRCEGDFQNNQLEGMGICLLPNGDRYEGEFKESRWHGRGVFYFALNGTEVPGIWQAGKLKQSRSPLPSIPDRPVLNGNPNLLPVPRITPPMR